MKKPLLFGIILTVCVVIVAFVFSLGYPGGMVSYWKFDVDEGTTASDSADANHGTIYGAQWTTAGMLNGALSFDGVDDYVEIPDDNSLDITGDLTLEAWIEPDRVYYTAQGEIIGKWVAGNASYYFAINIGKLQMRISATGSDYYNIEETSNVNLSIDTWYHVVGVYDASEQDIKLYINGVVEESTTVEGIIPSIIHSGSAKVKIGGFSPGYYFDGIIDEAAIYNRALSAGEIQQHYENRSYEVECTTPPDNMVSWWPGDETTGATTEDIVDANHGILVGDATFASGKVGNALSFDGVDDYVSIGNMGDFPVQGTIDFWMKADAVQNYRNPFTTNYIGDNSGIRFEEHSSHLGYTNAFYAVVGDDARNYGGHVFRYTANEPPYNNPMQANTWYHVALVWDTTANNVKGYWDGVKAFDVSHSFWPTELQDVAIGNGYSTDRYWDGLVDEVEIFNRALDASEIQAIYTAGSAGKCKVVPNLPPVAYAGTDQIVECTSPTGPFVTLDGSGSYDLDGDPLTYTWTGPFPEGDGTVTDVNPTVTLPPGTNTIILVVNDGQDDSEQDMVEINITLMSVEGFLPPLASLVPEGEAAPQPRKASKQGRALSLKLQLSCGTTVLSDTDVAPPRIVGLVRTDDASDLETIDMDAGQANDSGPLFRFSDPIWLYNLSTRDLSIGTYVITIEMPDGRLFSGTFMLR